MGDHTFMSFYRVLKRVRELSRLFGSNDVRSVEQETRVSFKNLVLDKEILSRTNANGFNNEVVDDSSPVIFFTPRPVSELDTAALTIQKCYKSYRTRRNLADCAVVVEELW